MMITNAYIYIYMHEVKGTRSFGSVRAGTPQVRGTLEGAPGLVCWTGDSHGHLDGSAAGVWSE